MSGIDGEQAVFVGREQFPNTGESDDGPFVSLRIDTTHVDGMAFFGRDQAMSLVIRILKAVQPE